MQRGTSILLVGCGKMGGALLAAWSGLQEHPYTLAVVEPAGSFPHSPKHTVHANTLGQLPASFAPDAIVFAVKPQVMPEVAPPYAERFGTGPLYLSIAAGIPLAFFATHIGEKARAVRAMPNMPALIGAGVTALAAAPRVTEADRALAEKLMQAAGVTVWVEERHMDAVTAISGSGPAYLYYFAECLMEAAQAQGLDAALAKTLTLHTLHGSAALALMGSEPLEALRRNITSPGGTTEAALRILMDAEGMRPLIARAVEAAVRRAAELSRV